MKKGECIRSEEVSVGRSAFFVDIFPCGVEDADVGKISAFLMNNSNHGVLVDISITLGEESKAVVNKKMSKKEGWGFDFKNVAYDGKLKVIVELTLKREEVVWGEDLDGRRIRVEHTRGNRWNDGDRHFVY